ncbi:hypothetical protein DRP04_15900, partial [Archaeoglobales archaeon]
DPGVGTKRKSIIIKTRYHYFVGADNGLFSLVAKEEGIERIIEITNERYMLERTGTFDGRDVFAPVAAYILRGVDIEKFGKELDKIEELHLPQPIFTATSISCEILHVDSFGNLITNIPASRFFEWAENREYFSLTVKRKKYKVSLSHSYGEAKTSLFLIKGSSELIEISMNKASAAKKLNVKAGDKLRIEKL